jgi:hypothetical protein
MSELEDAWAAVHDALPAGWHVNRPEYHVETDRWHVFAAGPPAGGEAAGLHRVGRHG